MQGSIEARGPGHWRILVFAGREDGRTKFISRTVAGTKRDAQVALTKLVTEVQSGRVTDSHSASVPELPARWLDAVAHERSAYTMLETAGWCVPTSLQRGGRRSARSSTRRIALDEQAAERSCARAWSAERGSCPFEMALRRDVSPCVR